MPSQEQSKRHFPHFLTQRALVTRHRGCSLCDTGCRVSPSTVEAFPGKTVCSRFGCQIRELDANKNKFKNINLQRNRHPPITVMLVTMTISMFELETLICHPDWAWHQGAEDSRARELSEWPGRTGLCVPALPLPRDARGQREVEAHISPDDFLVLCHS